MESVRESSERKSKRSAENSSKKGKKKGNIAIQSQGLNENYYDHKSDTGKFGPRSADISTPSE